MTDNNGAAPFGSHPVNSMADLSKRDRQAHKRQNHIVHNNIVRDKNANAKINVKTNNTRVAEVDLPKLEKSDIYESTDSNDENKTEIRFIDFKVNRCTELTQFMQSITNPLLSIMLNEGISADLEDDFRSFMLECIGEFKKMSQAISLPVSPVRDYEAGEGILNYLRSADGFGPWIKAGSGVLTRPLIREKAPKAYTALANWLRSNELPADLDIPTRSQALDAKAVTLMTLREAGRVARRKRGRSPAPAPSY